MGPISEEIEGYYLLGGEAQRLSNEWGDLERLRTEAILARRLPPPPAVIFDVGGAAGAYAFPLVQQGYQVHLIDLVELHLEQARAHAAASGIQPASITKGDARRLEFPGNSADAVLLFGPLYHLIDRGERMQAISEARRVLRPGGVLFAAGISRFAALIDGLSRGFFQDPKFRAIVEGDLKHGLHRNDTAKPEYFTTAYFHHPDELAAEVREAGFDDVEILAVEGPAWSAARFRDAWNDPLQRQTLLEFLSAIEAEPSIRGASAHMLAVGNRPG